MLGCPSPLDWTRITAEFTVISPVPPRTSNALMLQWYSKVRHNSSLRPADLNAPRAAKRRAEEEGSEEESEEEGSEEESEEEGSEEESEEEGSDEESDFEEASVEELGGITVGSMVEARDAGSVFKAKVLQTAQRKSKHAGGKKTAHCLVHFDGWNRRHDKWLEAAGLRPLGSRKRKAAQAVAPPPATNSRASSSSSSKRPKQEPKAQPAGRRSAAAASAAALPKDVRALMSQFAVPEVRGTPPQRGLYPDTVALISPDCDAMRLPGHQMPLIASGCAPCRRNWPRSSSCRARR